MFNLKEIEEITRINLFLFSLYAYTVVTTNIDLEKPKRNIDDEYEILAHLINLNFLFIPNFRFR